MRAAPVLAALAIAGTAHPAERAKVPQEEWWGTVESPMEFVAVSREGGATLRVKLVRPEEGDLVEIPAEDGQAAGYRLGDEVLPGRFWPGCTLIEGFTLRWGGRDVAIPRRFWRDLAGFRLQTTTLEEDQVDENLQWEFSRFREGLEQPRLIESADGGTLLIEWTRPEECDGRSTIRWIIGRSGAIMRHRDTPVHEC